MKGSGSRSMPPLWLAIYTVALVVWLGAFYLPLFFGGFPATIDYLDFSYYYAAARIGLQAGWSHIYDLQLQRALFYQLHPSTDIFDWKRYFVSPPPVAWLVAPLTLLPIVPAFWTWAVLLAAIFTAAGWLAVPGRGLARVALLLTAATIYPVLIALQTGQVTPLVAAATLLGWWLARRGRPMLAGLVLILLALKPQVAVLVPLMLLFTGQRRLFAVWLAGTLALGLASAATLGPAGLADLRTDLALEQRQTANLVWTLAQFTGPGLLTTVMQIGVAAAAVLIGLANRRQGLELAMVTGILGTLLAAPYHNPSDFAVLAPAAWLFLRSRGLSWESSWLALGVPACLLAARFGPALLILVLVAWLAALLIIAVRRAAERTRAAADLANR